MPGWSVTTDTETGNTIYTRPWLAPGYTQPEKGPAGLVRAGDLEPGRTYRVEFDDCCVKGSFTSELAEIVPDERDAGDYPDELRWVNGVVLEEFGQAEFWSTDD